MEATISQPTLHLRSSSHRIGVFRRNGISFPVQIGRRNNIFKKEILQCARGESASKKKLVVENEDELNTVEELNEKCRGIGGIVELMECLEREAIMGEDEGREASDYNRRAVIFDRSSRVFQALKQQSQSQTQTTATSTSCV